MQLQQYITTPLPNNVVSPGGFRFDVNNVETDPNHPVITLNTLQVDPPSFDTHAQHRDVITPGPFFTTPPVFQTPAVNQAYGQYVSSNGVLASASPDATNISSISVHDAARPPAAPLSIASDNSSHQTQRPLFDSSVGSYAPDGIVAHNGQDGFASCFTSREAQPTYHFPQSGPPRFDLLLTHQITADPQNLRLDGNDPKDITGHQDAQNLDTLGSGLEFLSEIFRKTKLSVYVATNGSFFVHTP